MAVLPLLKIRKHISIILALFFLFTKDLKESHIIERHSWIYREVANFVIQAHHIPAVGLLVLGLIIFYIEGVIYKSVNWYSCCWDVGGVIFSIILEIPFNWTGYAGNGCYTIVSTLDWLFYELEIISFFTSISKTGSLSSGTRRSIFPLAVQWLLPCQPSLRS